jgi:hypothetical protein
MYATVAVKSKTSSILVPVAHVSIKNMFQTSQLIDCFVLYSYIYLDHVLVHDYIKLHTFLVTY